MLTTSAVGRKGRVFLVPLLFMGIAPAFAQQASKASPQKTPARPATARNEAAATATQKLPLRRVVLYKSGVGYFEHDGTVRGNQDVEIDLTSSQLDDVLKSLTALCGYCFFRAEVQFEYSVMGSEFCSGLLLTINF